tara:strand:- start:52 stop:831 length:780 start_codon:yes stop_codon:yes gene_type:complete
MKLRDWHRNLFNKKSKIEWPCPNCGNSTLVLNADKFESNETAESKKARDDHDYWDYDWIRLIFNGILECQKCNETIVFNGYGNVEHRHFYDQVSDEYSEELVETYSPTFFLPPLHVIKIPANCPEMVRDEIIDSFKLFWFDLSSCANKIRTALEILLSEQKVNKTALTKKGNRRRLKLHERIIEYKKENSEIADYLLAIKWIGNSGSHVGVLERSDILDAYEILEFSLNKIFDEKELKIKKMASEINKRKGTRKKKSGK